jgi:rhodanese-related sulfurtransferase
MPPSAVEPIRCAKRMPELDIEIVVYCANPSCDDSVVTGERLRGLGYTNVRHYPGGKDEWKELGLPLERAGKPFSDR